MLRYTILVLSAVMAISTAASAQITFSIGGGNNGYYRDQCPPPDRGYYGDYNYNYDYRYNQNPNHYYCNQHRMYCNHPQNGYYGDDYRRKRRRRSRRRYRRANRNQCPPPGHYYCQTHRSYCSH